MTSSGFSSKYSNMNEISSIIKVIGVGGGGGNAVNHMYKMGIRGVDFFICNTDIQALALSPIPNKIQIGRNLTQGLGAGANPEKGRNAALESKEELREILSHNTKMLFITSGMGGGTGTGAAPVIAEVSRELGILTVGIVTAPFEFEGKPKQSRAQDGIDELRKYCDCVIVILNDRLRDVYGKASIKEAFRQADNVLARAAKSIAEIITVAGTINVDFEDVRTVMKEAGAAVMGSSVAEGENRARRAAEAAISSPLLNNTNIYGAKYILLCVVVGNDEDFQMEELEIITAYVQEQAGDNAEVIYGQAIDENLGDSISVTIIATGFENKTAHLTIDHNRTIDLGPVVKKTVPSYTYTPPVIPKNPVVNTSLASSASDDEDFFDKTHKEQASKNAVDKIIYGLDDSYQESELDKKKRLTLMGGINTTLPLTNDDLYAHKKAPQKDMGKTIAEMNDDDLKELRDVPAYMRRKLPMPVSKNIYDEGLSRLKIDENNDLIGGNKFLHDNVD
ncbi:MAG: cell division protein FtsZ [Cytophagales bacterium]|nr:MAG: cell division protein FtsZ [Cytophagales bacterium]TAF60369.1 MAG: cell division protein FtsZ [Cytophagales bacterium]